MRLNPGSFATVDDSVSKIETYTVSVAEIGAREAEFSPSLGWTAWRRFRIFGARTSVQALSLVGIHEGDAHPYTPEWIAQRPCVERVFDRFGIENDWCVQIVYRCPVTT